MNHNSPHDALVHAIFSSPENAAGELRAVLPPELAARVDWSTLRLESGHHVDGELANSYSDLVYSAKLDGREVLFQSQGHNDAAGDHPGRALPC